MCTVIAVQYMMPYSDTAPNGSKTMNQTLIQIPTLEECRKLFDTYQMLPNIREHSEMVMRVTERITKHLQPRCPVHRPLCIAAALLHDITKTASFQTGEPHAESAAHLLRTLGYPEIADIVSQHVTLRGFDHRKPVNEAEIIYYADKRVKHNQFVSVEERIVDLLERYGTTEEQRRRIMKMKDTVIDIEGKLEHCLDQPVDTIFHGL